MLLVISPAKTLDYTSAYPPVAVTTPAFLPQATALNALCRQLTPAALASLMQISDKLAALNVARFAEWQPTVDAPQARPAIFAFKGDVYTGLDVDSLSAEDLAYAQSVLCMLSGLYGLLRPLDAMWPYRLEMGSRLANPAGKDLYAFWGGQITEALNQRLAVQAEPVLINLASQEYFDAVQPAQLKARIVSPVFEDEKNGRYKIISFHAKKARGLMTRFVVQGRLTRPEQLLDFTLGGYAYAPEVSTADRPVFRRAER